MLGHQPLYVAEAHDSLASEGDQLLVSVYTPMTCVYGCARCVLLSCRFRGGHTIPPAIAAEALSWFLGLGA